MGLLKTVSEFLKPAADLVNNVHTSDDERLKAQNEFLKLQTALIESALEHEQKLIDAQTAIITAEANGQSWLQRSWRPITMLTFLVLIVADSFGFTAADLSERAWDLLQLGIGGYVIGRSVEKIAPKVIEAVKPKK